MQVQELNRRGLQDKSGVRFRNRVEDAGPQTNPHTSTGNVTKVKKRARIQTTEERPKITGNTLRYKTTARDEIRKKYNAENSLNTHSRKPGNSVRFERKTVASDTQEERNR